MRPQTHSDRHTGKPETRRGLERQRRRAETAEGHGERGWEKHGVSWRQVGIRETVALGGGRGAGEPKGQRSSPALIDQGRTRKVGWSLPFHSPSQDSRTQTPPLS